MILLSGANGQLGQEFQAYFRAQAMPFLATDRAELDITRYDDVMTFVAGHSLTGIINCAAYNNVDLAEKERTECEDLNTLAPFQLAQAAREKGIRFATYSSDFVFDGRSQRPYLETDAPNPLSHYGQTKLEGERRVLAAYPEALVIRTSWLFGQYGRNFVKNFIDLCQTRQEIAMVDDQVSAPTSTVDLVHATMALWDAAQAGLFHCSNAGEVSKYDYAATIAQLIGWGGTLKRVKTADFPAAAVRPLHSKLNAEKIADRTGYRLPPWSERVEELIAQGMSRHPGNGER